MNRVNISIDDVSPHPQSSTKVLDRCFELISVFPDIKFTLFIPCAYWRTIGSTATNYPFLLTDYSNFCEKIQQLPSDIFQIGYHGYYHGIPGINNNDEFADLNYHQAVEKFTLMMKTVRDCHLQDIFAPIFRPPAWRMSPESIRASFHCGIKHLALFPIGLKESHGFLHAESYKGVDKQEEYNVSYASCFPPFKELKLEPQTSIVYHACEWDKNYFSKSLSKNLELFLLSKKEDLEFNFIGDDMIKTVKI